MNARSCAIAAPTALALDDLAGRLGMLDEIVDERVDPARAGVAEDLDRSGGQVGGRDHAGAQRVVDVVVDVRDPVHQPHDLALERRRLRRAPGVADDPVAHRLGQVQPVPVALERVDDPQRVLVVQEPRAEALAPGSGRAPPRRCGRTAGGRGRGRGRSPRPGPRSARSARATVRETCVTSSVCVSRVR